MTNATALRTGIATLPGVRRSAGTVVTTKSATETRSCTTSCAIAKRPARPPAASSARRIATPTAVFETAAVSPIVIGCGKRIAAAPAPAAAATSTITAVAGECAGADRPNLVEREPQTQAEEQEDQAERRETLDRLAVRDVTGREGSDDDAGREVAEDRIEVQPRGDEPADAGSREGDGQVGEERLRVHRAANVPRLRDQRPPSRRARALGALPGSA